jgi:hypothetical protein
MLIIKMHSIVEWPIPKAVVKLHLLLAGKDFVK